MSESKPSKSAKKRENLALQKLGEELIALRASDLQTLSLNEELLQAVLEAQQIKSHGALRRQRQYIGKLMRHVDPDPVRVGIAKLSRS